MSHREGKTVVGICAVVLWLFVTTLSAAAVVLPPVDPDSDTDNTVNQFLLTEVAQGRTQTIAGGGWWGPVERFATNQLWAVAKSESGVFSQGYRLIGRVACLTPGGGNGYGTVQNTLIVRNLMFKSVRHRYAERLLQNGEFITLENRGYRNVAPGKTDLVRTQCYSVEGRADIFAPGIPVANDILRTGLKIPLWYEFAKPVLDNTPASFNTLGSLVRSGTLQSVPISAQAWYQNTGYHYTVLDSTVLPNGRFVPAVDLAGSTLFGTVRFHWYAMRGAREESHGTSDFQSEVHHMELRVEEGGEDYTYFKEMSSVEGEPLSPLNYMELFTDLDTTILTDGWHIISFHSHAIDRGTLGAAHNMQLAAELKIPVCIENRNSGACAGGPDEPFPTPTPTVANPSMPTATATAPAIGTVTPTPSATVRPPVEATPVPNLPSHFNLLSNGDFLRGMESWQWYDSDGSVPEFEEGLIILPRGDHDNMHLSQFGLYLVNGQRYVLKIRAQSLTDGALVDLYLHKQYTPQPRYGLAATISVGPEWTTQEIVFTAENFGDSTDLAQLKIRPLEGVLLIDSIELTTAGKYPYTVPSVPSATPSATIEGVRAATWRATPTAPARSHELFVPVVVK